MAAVYKRIYESGTEVFRVVLRKKGVKFFSLTFDDWGAACEWVEKNEEKYYANPKWYIDWRKAEFRIMRQTKIKVRNHLVRSKTCY